MTFTKKVFILGHDTIEIMKMIEECLNKKVRTRKVIILHSFLGCKKSVQSIALCLCLSVFKCKLVTAVMGFIFMCKKNPSF